MHREYLVVKCFLELDWLSGSLLAWLRQRAQELARASLCEMMGRGCPAGRAVHWVWGQSNNMTHCADAADGQPIGGSSSYRSQSSKARSPCWNWGRERMLCRSILDFILQTSVSRVYQSLVSGYVRIHQHYTCYTSWHRLTLIVNQLMHFLLTVN